MSVCGTCKEHATHGGHLLEMAYFNVASRAHQLVPTLCTGAIELRCGGCALRAVT